jgi:predicted lipoprotein with Yx(FWY)xxD motif
MNRLIAITAGAGAIAALAVGCGSSGSSSSSSSSSSKPASSPSSSSSTPVASAATVHTANSKYGQILVDGSGRTLYMLTADKGPMSTCYSTCASIWPPQTTTGMPANSGVTASLVGTTTRTDNTMQVVYNGDPLYTFSHDAKAGDVNGEGLATFGGTWYVVGTNGNAITAVPSTAPSTPAPSSSGGGYNY